MQLSCEDTDEPAKSGRKNEPKSSDDLIFVHGKTNPVIFLDEFEKCTDVKTAKDKLFKIRNFVNQSDRSEFSALFFKATARQAFLKKNTHLPLPKIKEKNLPFALKRKKLCARLYKEK